MKEEDKTLEERIVCLEEQQESICQIFTKISDFFRIKLNKKEKGFLKGKKGRSE